MSTLLMGSLVLPDRIVEGTISIDDGKIVQITEGFPHDAAQALDFRGKYLLPGLIEVHGHMREPVTFPDPSLGRGVNVLEGKITHEAVAEAHGFDHTPLSDVLPLAPV